MNKMNKKGFTLIEMLVVIAIIAVLVSIVVPVVSNSTEKAAAAANAANLRTVAAQVAIWRLEDPDTVKGTLTATGGKITAGTYTCDAPAAKAVSTLGINKGTEMTIVIGTDNVVAKYGEKTIADFAGVADGTTKPTTP